LPRNLASDLVALGHFAEHVYDVGIGGAKDPAVFAHAQSEQLTILTGDKDFSNIRVYTPPHAGIVVEGPDVTPQSHVNNLSCDNSPHSPARLLRIF
jgi:predicted nuclease of predicted toxin-antitoxin system